MIDSHSVYYLHQIAREGWLGTKSPYIVRRIITEHKEDLKPEFIGQGRSTRILVHGASLQRFQRKQVVLARRGK